MKRIFDLTMSSAMILAVFPFIIMILLAVFLLTGDSPLFFQDRKTTLDKPAIQVIKIRTIKSSKQFKELEKKSDDAFNKEEYENYVPKFCRYLRKSGIDELPQLINVIKGEMSLVGPRPLNKQDLIIMKTKQPYLYSRRVKLKSKPGVTGYWQVYGDRKKGAKDLIEKDEYYESNKSFLFDLSIIVKTLYVIFTVSHSDSIFGKVIINERNANKIIAAIQEQDLNKTALSKAEHVTLKVYDEIGRQVKTLVDENKAAGQYNV